MQSFEKFVGNVYLAEQQEEETPLRFQVTMHPDVGSEVVRIAESCDLSRSAVITFLCEHALDNLRAWYNADLHLEKEKKESK